MSERKIEMMPLNAITGAQKNPKRHSHEDIEKSISRFGYVEPVVLDERTGRLVAGHGRVQALRVAKKTGDKPPQGVVEKGGEWLVPVLRGWASRSDTEAEAYLVASNHLTTKGGWDDGELAKLLQSLNEQAALDGTGFDSSSIDEVLRRASEAEEPAQGLTDPDEVPEADASGVALGDMFRLGDHVLLCGDSTKEADVDRVMAGEAADLVWTDPPYGVDMEAVNEGLAKTGRASKTRTTHGIENDLSEDLQPLLRGAFAACFRAMKPGGFIYVAHPSGDKSLVFYDEIRTAGFRFKCGLVWVKDSMVISRSDYHGRHEPIIYALKPGGEGRRGRFGNASGWYGDDSQTSVFEVPRPKRSDEHPTMKPVELVEAMVRNSSAPGHLVFEPFNGSGTTLMACERLGRRCRAIELSPVYVARTVARWEAFTGKKAERVTS